VGAKFSKSIWGQKASEFFLAFRRGGYLLLRRFFFSTRLMKDSCVRGLKKAGRDVPCPDRFLFGPASWSSIRRFSPPKTQQSISHTHGQRNVTLLDNDGFNNHYFSLSFNRLGKT
jgi:hypothetical protein